MQPLNLTQTSPTLEEISQRLTTMLAAQLRMRPEEISLTQPLSEYGLDSINAVSLAGDIEDWLGFQLPSTLLWDYPTTAALAGFLAEAAANPEARLDPDSDFTLEHLVH
jgi:phthiocerol/phenolphthiocerol synthesis type-I polyketide synthase C